MEVYNYYRDRILEGALSCGSRMPSLRRCAQEWSLSRTTIENAYLQLAADGYIAAKAQSGYYVTDIAKRPVPVRDEHKMDAVKIRYDFASTGVDPESFRFDLWRRYMKSALRQDERLSFYGEPQGEADLRQELAEYVREHRNILCSPQDIVVGAGTQSLLQILVPLLKERRTVSFPTSSFVQGSTVFADYGFEVFYRNKACSVIYVSPAHMTKWGEIMPVSRRLELVRHAADGNHLIIEDDYENEFVYSQRPTPSLFGLDGGEHVVYIGSFSRLLLPSVRVGFMVLPTSLRSRYQEKCGYYNQTASKAEQIALCQYIRDGHLAAQTRRLRRVYAQKLKSLEQAVREVFTQQGEIQRGEAGTALALTVPCGCGADYLRRQAGKCGIRVRVLSARNKKVTLLLSCLAMPEEDYLPACRKLRDLLSETVISVDKLTVI